MWSGLTRLNVTAKVVFTYGIFRTEKDRKLIVLSDGMVQKEGFVAVLH